MGEANARLRDALAAEDAEAAIGADDDFHGVPVRVSGNPLIAEQLENVTLMLRRAEYLHFGTLTGAASPGQHDAIMDALRAGDADAAAELTRRNWRSLSGS
jgi:DNA-binding GntR family transcriptional regulator